MVFLVPVPGPRSIGLDRFAGFANTREDPGLLLTKPMSIEHGMIEVNVESYFSSDNDSLRVAIRDTMGDDIADIRLKTAS